MQKINFETKKKKKVIWILYCSRKGGHTYPVESLYNYINENHGIQFTPRKINLLDLSPFVSFIGDIGRYGDLKLRRIWRCGYKNLQNENQVFIKVWGWAERLLFNYIGLKNRLILNGGKPDIIVSIQPEVNNLSHLLKKWYKVPIHTIIIDLAIHGLWLDKLIDHYYVFDGTLSLDLQSRGITSHQITVSGIPIRSNFSNVIKNSINETRKKLGINEELPTLLILGGLLGKMVNFNKVIQSLINIDLPLQLLIVFGKNEKSKLEVSHFVQNSKIPIFCYGVVSNMNEMMWAADLVISKPGSVTIAESLALGKPMLVILPEAGSAQEFRFANFLTANGAGKWIEKPEATGVIIKEILFSQKNYQTLHGNAHKLGNQSLTANHTIMQNLIKSLN